MELRPGRLSNPRHLAFLAAVGALLWSLTCGPQDQPLAPHPGASGSSVPTILARPHPDAGLLGDTSVSVKITRKKGGTVSLGECTLEVPPHSVNKDVTVTIKAPDAALILFEMLPDGLLFDPPATLSISYAGLAVEGIDGTLGIWTQEEGQAVWIPLGGAVDTVNQVVSTPLSHFSRYALASD